MGFARRRDSAVAVTFVIFKRSLYVRVRLPENALRRPRPRPPTANHRECVALRCEGDDLRRWSSPGVVSVGVLAA